MKVKKMWEEGEKGEKTDPKTWVEKQYGIHKKNGFQWLDSKVVNQYYRLFENSNRTIRVQKALCDELIQIYGVTEVEAMNILRGCNVGDYINKYERIRTKTPVNVKKSIKDKGE